jgi:hypothetical protein
MRTLPFGYEIELDFFHGNRIGYLTIENLNWQKWTLRDCFLKSLIIGHNVAIILVKSCNFIADVWVHPCFETSWVGQEWHIES